MSLFFLFFFFNDTATTEIYTLSLHDALPISLQCSFGFADFTISCLPENANTRVSSLPGSVRTNAPSTRSEEHTSELQSQSNLVCRLLLEKKKYRRYLTTMTHHN